MKNANIYIENYENAPYCVLGLIEQVYKASLENFKTLEIQRDFIHLALMVDYHIYIPAQEVERYILEVIG